MDTQVKLVYACTALQNFLCQTRTEDDIDIFEETVILNERLAIEEELEGETGWGGAGAEEPQSHSTCAKMDELRDTMAEEVWVDYKHYLQRGGDPIPAV